MGLPPTLSTFSLLLPGHKVSGFALPCAPAMMCHHRPKVKALIDDGLKPLQQ
jgi:hypothetical protein